MKLNDPLFEAAYQAASPDQRAMMDLHAAIQDGNPIVAKCADDQVTIDQLRKLVKGTSSVVAKLQALLESKGESMASIGLYILTGKLPGASGEPYDGEIDAEKYADLGMAALKAAGVNCHSMDTFPRTTDPVALAFQGMAVRMYRMLRQRGVSSADIAGGVLSGLKDGIAEAKAKGTKRSQSTLP